MYTLGKMYTPKNGYICTRYETVVCRCGPTPAPITRPTPTSPPPHVPPPPTPAIGYSGAIVTRARICNEESSTLAISTLYLL